MRITGTAAMGIRLPIMKDGDDLGHALCDALEQGAANGEFKLSDGDIVALTESILARCQGNFIKIDSVTNELKEKFDKNIGVIFPVLSRNRFAPILDAITRTELPITLVLNYPVDEVGNRLMDEDLLVEKNINPFVDTITEDEYRKMIGGDYPHPFTGIDYVNLYKSMAINDNINILLSNNPLSILEYTDEILIANVHDRFKTKKALEKAGAKKIYLLDDLARENKGEGYNPDFGLLGANLASKKELKLFPRDSQKFVDELQKLIKKRLGKDFEVMIYGDGAFKDPVGKIWELADPVVSPAYTSGLEGMPHEVKLKYIADNELEHLKGEELEKTIIKMIEESSDESEKTVGTTPRHITDLLGSLADLISGSGDKGTPVVLIQGYFDNYATK